MGAITIVVSQLDGESPTDPHFTQHSSFLKGGLPIASDIDEGDFQKEWQRVVGGLAKAAANLSDAASEWRVDTIEAGLTFTAKGKLAFIADASAQANFKVVLKRKSA